MAPRPMRPFLILALALTMAACSTGNDSRSPDHGVSPTLRKALDRLAEELDRGQWDPDGARTLQTYHWLRGAVRDPERRQAASDSFLAVWKREPEQVLWLELNTLEAGFLERPEERREQLLAAAGPDTGSAVHQFALARMFWGRRPVESRQRFLRADTLSGPVHDVSSAWIALRAAEVLAGRENQEEASAKLIELLPLCLRYGGPSLAGLGCRSILVRAQSEGRLTDAVAAARMAITCAETVGDEYLRVRLLQSLGNLHRELWEYESADSLLVLSAKIAEEHNLPGRVVWAHGYRAQLGERLGLLDLEIESLAKNRELSLAIGDTGQSLRASAALGNALRRAGRLEEAERILDSGDALDRAWSGSEAARLSQARAALWMQLGRYAEAESLRIASEQANRSRGDYGAVLVSLTLLIRQGIETNRPGISYRALRRGEQLLSQHQIHASANFDPARQFLLDAARLHARQGEFLLADENLRRARERKKVGTPQAEWFFHEAVAQVAEQAGDLETAQHHWRQCLELAGQQGDPDLRRRSRGSLAAVLLRNDDPAGALELVESDRDAPEYWNRLNAALVRGMALRQMGRYREAIADLEQTRRLLTTEAPADLAARVGLERGRSLAAIGRIEEAFETLLAVQGRLQRERSAVRSELGRTYNAHIERETAEALLAVLWRRSNDVARDRADAQRARGIAAWGRGQAESGVSGPRIEYFVGQEKAYAWVHGPRDTGFRWRELPGSEELAGLVGVVEIDLGYPGRAIDPEPLNRLGAALLAPLQDRWPAGSTLEIVADGPLYGLPWWALPLPVGGEFPAGRVLDHGAVVLVDGPGQPAREGMATGRLLAIATDGDADDEGPQLRRAEAEARLIADEWTGGPVELLLGSESTGTSWSLERLAGHEVIHLSSHTRIYEGASGHSALYVAGGHEPLTVPEVAEAHLDAKLVFLSSCEGGRRHRTAGRGVGSFAEAFLRAGAHRVIAAGVPVDDEAAGRMAASFYRHWLDGKSRAEALRSALLEVSGSGSGREHPFYWSFYNLYRSPVD